MAIAMPVVKDSFTGPRATFDMVKLEPSVRALSLEWPLYARKIEARDVTPRHNAEAALRTKIKFIGPGNERIGFLAAIGNETRVAGLGQMKGQAEVGRGMIALARQGRQSR